MLTLVQTKDAVPLLGIYAAPERPGDKSTSMRKRRTGTVYFTHDLDPDKQNVSDASGVLHLHKTYLKKENHVNNYEFEEIAHMLDEEQEPDMHHPLKHAYWNIRQNFDRYLRREMFIGEHGVRAEPELEEEGLAGDDDADRQLGRRQDAISHRPGAALPARHAGPQQAPDPLAEPRAGD